MERAHLRLEERVGQLLCCGWCEPNAYLQLNAQARHCVRNLHAGAVLLMGRNVQMSSPTGMPSPPVDARAVLRMNRELQALASTPLLIATDQEGGRVQRLRGAPFTRIPPAEQVGKAGDAELARQLGTVIARELAAVGIGWDFAPVCDVRTAATNKEIGNRAWGEDPQRNGALIAAHLVGMRAGGVLPCVKHFPGQGATPVDSHQSLPTLASDASEWRAHDLIPFAAALRAGAPLAVMAAHITMPKMDQSGLPASLSPTLLTGMLRQRMHFDGIVITDDLEMGAIENGWGIGPAAVRAIQAGADMVLVCHYMESQQAVFDALLKAAKTGTLSAARIDEANRRIAAAKRWVGARPAVPLSVLGCREHQAVVQAIEDRAHYVPPA